MEQSNQPNQQFRCGECGQSFKSQSELRNHERSCKQQADEATATGKNR